MPVDLRRGRGQIGCAANSLAGALTSRRFQMQGNAGQVVRHPDTAFRVRLDHQTCVKRCLRLPHNKQRKTFACKLSGPQSTKDAHQPVTTRRDRRQHNLQLPRASKRSKEGATVKPIADTIEKAVGSTGIACCVRSECIGCTRCLQQLSLVLGICMLAFQHFK